MRYKIDYDLKALRGDLFGGVTASVVGLPVALAFGVASGLGAIAGLYGAIAVGFFSAVFGGTKSQISGPTGPMAVAMAVIVTTHSNSLAEAFTVVVMAGVIQILLGVLRIGRFVAYTPYSVISGFMSGIGIIIMILQVLPFLGADTLTGGPRTAIRAMPDAIQALNYNSFVIAIVTLSVGVLWPRRLRRYLPPTLAALIAGTLIGVLWLTATPVIGEVPSGLPEFQIPLFDAGLLASAIQPALILALLGSIDSLLTSLIADSITRTQHSPNRELVGQGIGNAIAGMIGGLPGAGATLGTVVNIRAGGRSRLSGVLRAAILLALVLGLGKIRRIYPPRSSGRYSHEGRLGHNRLALPNSNPQSPERAPTGDGDHPRAHRFPRPRHRSGNRSNCCRYGRRPSVRTPGVGSGDIHSPAGHQFPRYGSR